MQSIALSLFLIFEFTMKHSAKNVANLCYRTTPSTKDKQTTHVNFHMALPKIIMLLFEVITCTRWRGYPPPSKSAQPPPLFLQSQMRCFRWAAFRGLHLPF